MRWPFFAFFQAENIKKGSDTGSARQKLILIKKQKNKKTKKQKQEDAKNELC